MSFSKQRLVARPEILDRLALPPPHPPIEHAAARLAATLSQALGSNARPHLPSAGSSVDCLSVAPVLDRSTRRVLRFARWRDVTGLCEGAAVFGTNAQQPRNPATENHVDHQLLIAQCSGRLRQGFVPPAALGDEPPRCALCVAPHRTLLRTMFAAEMRQAGVAQAQRGTLEELRLLRNAEGGVAGVARLRWWPREAAAGARTASGWRATSSARGAARSATSSARRSAGTPSTRLWSTKSPPSPAERRGQAVSTAGSRLERKDEAGTVGRALVTAARSRAEVRPVVAALARRQRLATEPSLTPEASGARVAASGFGTLGRLPEPTRRSCPRFITCLRSAAPTPSSRLCPASRSTTCSTRTALPEIAQSDSWTPGPAAKRHDDAASAISFETGRGVPCGRGRAAIAAGDASECGRAPDRQAARSWAWGAKL